MGAVILIISFQKVVYGQYLCVLQTLKVGGISYWI